MFWKVVSSTEPRAPACLSGQGLHTQLSSQGPPPSLPPQSSLCGSQWGRARDPMWVQHPPRQLSSWALAGKCGWHLGRAARWRKRELGASPCPRDATLHTQAHPNGEQMQRFTSHMHGRKAVSPQVSCHWATSLREPPESVEKGSGHGWGLGE